jgi:thioredoxin 1
VRTAHEFTKTKAGTMSSTKAVTDATFQSEVIEHETPILVDFWAKWCGPCRAVAPILDKIAQENTPRFSIVKLNIDETRKQ